jgi:hypothetical protein
MKNKTFMGIMLLVAAMILSASGTCFAAVANSTLLQPESGVSFAVAPVVADIVDYGQNGAGFSGGTVYIQSGGMVSEDMSPVWAGVSIWQARSDGQYAEILGADPYSNNGATTDTGATIMGVASLTMVPSSGNGGVSVFATLNNWSGYGGIATDGVTGFTIIGISHDSQNRVTFPVYAHDSGVTGVGILHPPAYSSNWMQNSATVSGDSLFFGTSGVSMTPFGGPNTGATLYCLKANIVNANADTADANNVLAYAFESRVSSFVCGPVIKEGRSGISVFILGALGNQNGSGVSLLGYQGANFAAIGNGAPSQINYRIDPLASTYELGDAVTRWPTPALGEGTLNWTANNYSGNSLFVTDGLGGVSIFDVNIAANTTQAGIVVRFHEYSNDRAASSVSPIPGPATDGRYLVLPSANGVSI